MIICRDESTEFERIDGRGEYALAAVEGRTMDDVKSY